LGGIHPFIDAAAGEKVSREMATAQRKVLCSRLISPQAATTIVLVLVIVLPIRENEYRAEGDIGHDYD